MYWYVLFNPLRLRYFNFIATIVVSRHCLDYNTQRKTLLFSDLFFMSLSDLEMRWGVLS